MAELEAQKQPVDPIAQLHKMSTTAGVGTQEYVAINPLAVTAGIIGLLSAIIFFADSWVLLAVPAAAVILAGLAFRQISNSGGTQTGMGLAGIGLLLALAMGGGRVWTDWREEAATRADRKEIDHQIQLLNDNVLAGSYGDAYNIFAEVFRRRVPQETFEGRWKMFQDPRTFKIKSITGNGIVHFEEVGGAHVALTKLIITLDRAGGKDEVVDRPQIELLNSGSHAWQIYSFEWFPLPQKKQ